MFVLSKCIEDISRQTALILCCTLAFFNNRQKEHETLVLNLSSEVCLLNSSEKHLNFCKCKGSRDMKDGFIPRLAWKQMTRGFFARLVSFYTFALPAFLFDLIWCIGSTMTSRWRRLTNGIRQRFGFRRPFDILHFVKHHTDWNNLKNNKKKNNKMKCVLVHNRTNLILYLKNADKLALKESRDLEAAIPSRRQFQSAIVPCWKIWKFIHVLISIWKSKL